MIGNDYKRPFDSRASDVMDAKSDAPGAMMLLEWQL
jgi:hypothetical protein